MRSQNRRAALKTVPTSTDVTLTASASVDLMDQLDHIRNMIGGVALACESLGDDRHCMAALVYETRELVDAFKRDLRDAFGKA